MRIDLIAIPLRSANEPCPSKDGVDIECGAGSIFGSLIERLQEHVETQPQRQCVQSIAEGAPGNTREFGMVQLPPFSDTALATAAGASVPILEQSSCSRGSCLSEIASELLVPGFQGAAGTPPLSSSTSGGVCAVGFDIKLLDIEPTVLAEPDALGTPLAVEEPAGAAAAATNIRPARGEACQAEQEEKGVERQILDVPDPLMATVLASLLPSPPPPASVSPEVVLEGSHANSTSTDSPCPEPASKNESPVTAPQASSVAIPVLAGPSTEKSLFPLASPIGLVPIMGPVAPPNPVMPLSTTSSNPASSMAVGLPLQPNAAQLPQPANLPAPLPIPAQAAEVQLPEPAFVIRQASLTAIFTRLPSDGSVTAGIPSILNGSGSSKLPDLDSASKVFPGTEKSELTNADSVAVSEKNAKPMLAAIVKSALEKAEVVPETRVDAVLSSIKDRPASLSKGVDAITDAMTTIVSPGILRSAQGARQMQSLNDPILQATDAEAGKTASSVQIRPDSSVEKEGFPKPAQQDTPVAIAVPSKGKGFESSSSTMPAPSECRRFPAVADQGENAQLSDRPRAVAQEEAARPQAQVPCRSRADNSWPATDLPPQVEVAKGSFIDAGQSAKEPGRASAGNARTTGAATREHPPLPSGGFPGSNAVTEAKVPDLPRSGSAAPSSASNEFIQQLADRIQMNLQNGGNGLRIRLRPESLGQIEIRAENAAGGVIARIVTESADIKNYLENNLQSLQQTLQNQGLKIERIEIVVQDGFDTRHSAQGNTSGHGGADQHGGGTPVPSGVSVSRHGQSSDELVLDASAIRVLGPNSTFHTIA